MGKQHTETGATAARTASRSGAGRVLIFVYGIWALAATARSVVQLSLQFHRAPLAYILSAVAAVFYIVATISLARGDAASRRVARISCAIELLGVIVVGTFSVVAPRFFPDATVWSGYGIGYGFIPVVLPILGLLWLRHLDRVDSGAG